MENDLENLNETIENEGRSWEFYKILKNSLGL